MARAEWNGVVIAESDDTIILEGNHYFPRGSVNDEYIVDSPARTRCSWKGVAGYFDVVVKGQTNTGAAWYYADPKPVASDIKDYVAFWKGIRVTS